MIQITPLPVPQAPQATQPAQAVTNVLPQVQGQAAAPIGPSAVVPTPRAEKGQKTKGSADKEKDRADTSHKGKRGGSVNMSV